MFYGNLFLEETNNLIEERFNNACGVELLLKEDIPMNRVNLNYFMAGAALMAHEILHYNPFIKDGEEFRSIYTESLYQSMDKIKEQALKCSNKTKIDA